MKKSILFLFALFPILASCNNNGNGFINPFPNDPYEDKKLGFNFAKDEKPVRILTAPEVEILNDTILNIELINANFILREEGSIHERDYTRAFAGVFKDGYDASNMMYDETFVSFYQKNDSKSNPTETLRTRKKTTRHIDSTYDYSYGRNTSSEDYKSLTFLAGYPNEKVYDEVEDDADAKAAIEANYEIIKTGKEETENRISAKLLDEGSKEELLPYFYIKQSILELTSSDPEPEANAKNEVVLVKEEHKPYAGTGEYVLQDGRKYRATNNSLFVSVLSKHSTELEGGTIDYYLVESARTYTETVITSNVIQPNVPIDFLKKPIVINYKEEFHKFSNVNSEKSEEERLVDIEVTE